MTVIDPGMAPALLPLAWLAGTWRGKGVIGYPTLDQDREFEQEVEASHDGRPFLLWHSRTWLIDADGVRVRPLATEVGFWRAPGETPDDAATAGREVELLLTHATGILELYVGTVRGAQIDLATDVVARSPHAVEYSAGKRLYGMVEGDLLWAMDMAAVGNPLAPHASARLSRAPAA